MTKRIARASRDDAEKVTYFLETKRPAACNLVERINILLGLFQSTDAPKSRGGTHHEYYEQREWRIGHVFGPHTHTSWLDVMRGADEEAVALAQLLGIVNPCFFDQARLKDSAVLRGLSEPDNESRYSFFDFVTEVICPSTGGGGGRGAGFRGWLSQSGGVGRVVGRGEAWRQTRGRCGVHAGEGGAVTLCEVGLLDWLRVVLMPLAVAGLGYVVKVCVDRLERQRTLFDVATTWRIEVFRDLSSQLNDIYCYFTYQGNWLEFSPHQMTEEEASL